MWNSEARALFFNFSSVAHFSIGADALWYSFLASSVVSLALTLLVYFRLPWRRKLLARLAAAADEAQPA